MEVLLVTITIGAIGLAIYFGYDLARAKDAVLRSQEEAMVKSATIYAMKRTVEHQDELYKKLDEISRAETIDDLNRIYNRIISPE